MLFPLLVTWQAHGVAVNLVSFRARFCFKHPLGLLVPVQTDATIANR